MQTGAISSPVEIGARIREARITRNMSQAELAEKANVSLSHVSDIELGKTDIRLQGFIRIIEALQISADEIIRASVPEVSRILSSEYYQVLADCTPEEIHALTAITKQLKETMRTHKTEE